jgi:hypothetical protein
MTQEIDVIGIEPTRETPKITWEEVRSKRDAELLHADRFYNFDTPDALKQLWVNYKQALRDIPSTYADLEDLSEIVWPERPDMTQQLTLSGR